MNMITVAQKAIQTAIAEYGAAHVKDWGFSYYTKDEGTAFKIAYSYRLNPHGVKIEKSSAGEFMVTIFNEFSTTIGIDRF
jgi:hypothetical protein